MPICKHEHFAILIDIAKVVMPPDGHIQHMADLRLICTDCREPFHWQGVPMGASLDRPAVSIDGLELRIPVGPGMLMGIVPARQ
jgi:hypothetical protein